MIQYDYQSVKSSTVDLQIIFIDYYFSNINILTMLDRSLEPQRGRFEFTTKELLKYMTLAQSKYHSAQRIISFMGMAWITSVVSHQLIYLLQPKINNHVFSTSQKLARNIQNTRRVTEHTATIFTIKILIDILEEKIENGWSEYSKGAVTGLIGYIFSRPLDQVDLARQEILLNQKKSISRFEGLRVVLRHDGLAGLYRNQNMLGPFCATVYRSIYFGMWARLNKNSTSSNPLFKFCLIPLAASLSASLATAIPDKFRSYCLQISQQRSTAIEKKYKKRQISLKPVNEMLFEYISSSEFKFNKGDLAMIGYSVMKNWIILTLFGLGQHFTHKYMNEQSQ